MLYFWGMANYGAKIKEARIKANKTQVELSEKVGISQPALAKIESNTTENISLNLALKIANELDVDFGELFNISNLKNKDFTLLKQKIKTLQKEINDAEFISKKMVRFAAYTSFQSEKIREEFEELIKLIKQSKAINKKEINHSIQRIEILFEMQESNKPEFEELDKIIKTIKTFLAV